jgi:hypothetical protein
MKIRTLLLLFLFTSVVVNAQNLLTNPGFESGASVGYATLEQDILIFHLHIQAQRSGQLCSYKLPRTQ